MVVRESFALPAATVDLYGIEVAAVAPTATVVLVHDRGLDLDEFLDLPERLARAGFTAIAVDLPGHGLSEVDHATTELSVDAVNQVVRHAVDRGLPVGLVASGVTATMGSVLGRDHGVSAQVLVCPVLDETMAATGRREHAVRMVVHGEGPSLVGTATQRFFSPLIGEKLLVFNPDMSAGTAELVRNGALLAHVLLFFQRYLAPDSRSSAP
jgi:alpha-beta hydrolase superfamily lysophospholipase